MEISPLFSSYTCCISEEMKCLSDTLSLGHCQSLWCHGLMRLALCHSWQRPSPNTGYRLRRWGSGFWWRLDFLPDTIVQAVAFCFVADLETGPCRLCVLWVIGSSLSSSGGALWLKPAFLTFADLWGYCTTTQLGWGQVINGCLVTIKEHSVWSGPMASVMLACWCAQGQ